jgi:RNA polymerase sigma-70 factor (ECF subfamily)
MVATTRRDGLPALATPTSEMAHRAHARAAEPVPTFDDVYAANVAFVWRIARVFGVPPGALEDVVQDVFVVVHRRLSQFEGRAAITTWLFEITRRTALARRRRDDARRTEPLDVEPASGADTFAALSAAQAAATVSEILDAMTEDKRIVFALVELEQLSVPEVARMLDLNVNTAYSRLRLAREAFTAAVLARSTANGGPSAQGVGRPCVAADGRSINRPRSPR